MREGRKGGEGGIMKDTGRDRNKRGRREREKSAKWKEKKK